MPPWLKHNSKDNRMTTNTKPEGEVTKARAKASKDERKFAIVDNTDAEEAAAPAASEERIEGAKGRVVVHYS